MTIIADMIAAEIADVPASATALPVPTALGYGSDLSCVLDLTPTLEDVDPLSRRAVGEAILRRLVTPRGGLLDDPAYGFDLRGMLNRGVTQDALRSTADQARGEALKDDRVADADVTLSYVGTTLHVTARLALVDPALGTFDLVFAVTPDGTLLTESIT